MGPLPLSRVRYPQLLHGAAPSAVTVVVLDLPSHSAHAHTAHTPAGGNTAADRTRGRPCAGIQCRAACALELWRRCPPCRPAQVPLPSTRRRRRRHRPVRARARSGSLARLVHRCRAADARASSSAMPCMQVRMHAPRRPNLPGVNLSVQSIRHAGACARALGAPSVRARDMQCVGNFLVWFTLIFFWYGQVKNIYTYHPSQICFSFEQN
jgi:hypothetical protein